MNILTLNAGSSSIKFALFESGCDEAVREGEIAWADGRREQARQVVLARKGQKRQTVVAVRDDRAAADCAIEAALGGDSPAAAAVDVVGHRVVHGGMQFRETVLIDSRVKRVIAELGRLAPLHNPPALRAIEAAEAAFPGLPQVASFDTAFYANLQPKAFIYPLPYSYFEQWGIRRFGFHGLSNAWCASRAKQMLKGVSATPNLVICHLGSGCSATAVRDGTAIATTMGYSPLDGLMMCTRPGSLDPGVLLALLQQHGLSPKQVDHDLHFSSGLLGVSGVSPDLGEIEKAAGTGNQRAALAFDMFADRVRSAIAGLAVTLGRLDGLVFTDRAGEHRPALRARVCEGLELLGLQLDRRLNAELQPDADVATADSRGRILVIHTREELMIAREAARVVTGSSKTSEG
jgi:acetate kinase